MGRTLVLELTLLATSALLPACSDPPTASLDRATRTDLGPPADLGRDGQSRPDQYAGPCDPSCMDQDISLCPRLPGEGRCVECLDDSHCLGNPGALGNRCDRERNFCICDSDADCAGNHRGAHCELANQMCVCRGDSECRPPLPLCVGTDVKTCRPACLSDKDCGNFPKCDLATGRCLACQVEADCQNNLLNRHCEVSTGRCLACTKDSHCPAGFPYCSSGNCVECKQSAHCVLSPKGTLCNKGSCGCAGSGSCQSVAALGAICLTKPASFRCGCGRSEDCSGKALGPVCLAAYHWCGCLSDAQCGLKPSTTCIFPSDTADYRQCQPPCSSDPECLARLHAGVNAGLKKCVTGRCVVCSEDSDCKNDPSHPRCHKELGRCVSCTQNEHCGGLAPICDVAAGRCVECKVAADCAGHPNGPVCTAGRCGCALAADCAGPAVWGTSCLSVGTDKRCGCTKDGECAGKEPGPHCTTTSYKKCTCLSDNECKSGVCGFPHAHATYRYCQKPCQSAQDCAFIVGLGKCSPGGKCVACIGDGDCSPPRPYCNTGLGLCSGCLDAADCAGEEWAKLCDPAWGCAECLGNADCTTASLGKTCSKGSCVCATSADCTGNLNGKLCDPGVRACSCASDLDCPPPRKCTGSFFGVKICK